MPIHDVACDLDEDCGCPVSMMPRKGRPPIGSQPGEVMTIRLDPSLRRALEALAVLKRTTVTALIREGVRLLLKHEGR